MLPPFVQLLRCCFGKDVCAYSSSQEIAAHHLVNVTHAAKYSKY